MNERIRELAEQATIKSVSENFTGEKLEIITPSKEWTVKFAELIVRECMDICLSDDWEDQQGWGKMYAHKIKLQLGVKS